MNTFNKFAFLLCSLFSYAQCMVKNEIVLMKKDCIPEELQVFRLGQPIKRFENDNIIFYIQSFGEQNEFLQILNYFKMSKKVVIETASARKFKSVSLACFEFLEKKYEERQKADKEK